MRFQTKDGALRVNISKITPENTFNGDHFQIEGSHASVRTKSLWFGYFCKFVTSALVLRPRKTFIYVLGEFFDFFNF